MTICSKNEDFRRSKIAIRVRRVTVAIHPARGAEGCAAPRPPPLAPPATEAAEVELRYLADQSERQCFAQSLTQARARAGMGFMEKARSRIGAMHLQFSDLYGIFDEQAGADRMLAGFAIHALDMFSQSYREPDLTDLPPRSVLEVGELWSCSPGAAVSARWACGIAAILLEARALLIYPIVHPWDLTGSYPGFERAGAPIPWPYVQTMQGGDILVQPMVAREAALAGLTSLVSLGGFEVEDGKRVVRFSDPRATAVKIRNLMRRAGRGLIWSLPVPHRARRSCPPYSCGSGTAPGI